MRDIDDASSGARRLSSPRLTLTEPLWLYLAWVADRLQTWTVPLHAPADIRGHSPFHRVVLFGMLNIK